MTSNDLLAAVTSALSKVHNPRLGNDVLSTGMVQDLVVEQASGTVSFRVLLFSILNSTLFALALCLLLDAC